MWNTFSFAGDLRHRVGDAGVHVAEDDVDLVALDQLAGLLHAGADVVGGILDQKLDLAAEDAVLFVKPFNGVFGALDLAGGESGEDAGQRIDHADPHRGFPARSDDRRCGEDRDSRAGHKERTATKRGQCR